MTDPDPAVEAVMALLYPGLDAIPEVRIGAEHIVAAMDAARARQEGQRMVQIDYI